MGGRFPTAGEGGYRSAGSRSLLCLHSRRQPGLSSDHPNRALRLQTTSDSARAAGRQRGALPDPVNRAAGVWGEDTDAVHEFRSIPFGKECPGSSHSHGLRRAHTPGLAHQHVNPPALCRDTVQREEDLRTPHRPSPQPATGMTFVRGRW